MDNNTPIIDRVNAMHDQLERQEDRIDDIISILGKSDDLDRTFDEIEESHDELEERVKALEDEAKDSSYVTEDAVGDEISRLEDKLDDLEKEVDNAASQDDFESTMKEVEADMDSHAVAIKIIREDQCEFMNMGFWARLIWVLTGKR